ncbi:hypothetical protein BGZ63DRAFT_397486 [Mariannaea sp. PMI_226]|nr:hypothetical protein BGZ63DRAFT_397486 [Mariannaea sp. PMI_226]
MAPTKDLTWAQPIIIKDEGNFQWQGTKYPAQLIPFSAAPKLTPQEHILRAEKSSLSHRFAACSVHVVRHPAESDAQELDKMETGIICIAQFCYIACHFLVSAIPSFVPRVEGQVTCKPTHLVNGACRITRFGRCHSSPNLVLILYSGPECVWVPSKDECWSQC